MVSGQTECAAPGYAMRCVGRCSALRCPMQRAGIILAASRNLRLQVADGRTKPSDGHPKTAYVHPKTANGDFIKHTEDFHHAAGTDSEGWRETSENGKTSIRRQQDNHPETVNPNRSLEFFLCKKSDYSRLCHRYSICMLTQYADFALFQDKMKANFSNDRFRVKASADVRLHTSGCLLDDEREGATPPLAAAFYPRVN